MTLLVKAIPEMVQFLKCFFGEINIIFDLKVSLSQAMLGSCVDRHITHRNVTTVFKCTIELINMHCARLFHYFTLSNARRFY
jgi:hypothetical protein